MSIVIGIIWTIIKRNYIHFCLILGYPIQLTIASLYLYTAFLNNFLIFWGNAAINILTKNLKHNKDRDKCKSNSTPIYNQNSFKISHNFNIVSNSVPINTNLNSNAQNNVVIAEKDVISHSDFRRTKSFFENENFLEFSWREHLYYYKKFIFDGIDESYNLLNSCSYLNSIKTT